ncbi:hypothetical protein JOC27_002355 [Sporolactobacillus spathodeae]|uniref:Uncharacterized protein n=1 Tax=Sporolactobacillus spathodeae TaxID=1465502 RepID=A0ABS2QAR7_9BACL|nr:hypothetical protein [Sporolactobacillus spathodeae]
MLKKGYPAAGAVVLFVENRRLAIKGELAVESSS